MKDNKGIFLDCLNVLYLEMGKRYSSIYIYQDDKTLGTLVHFTV